MNEKWKLKLLDLGLFISLIIFLSIMNLIAGFEITVICCFAFIIKEIFMWDTEHE